MAGEVASIWPVLLPTIIGGSLALVGGAISPFMTHFLTSKALTRSTRAKRFEEMVIAVNNHSDWVSRRVSQELFSDQTDPPQSHLFQGEMIAAIYFPLLLPHFKEISIATLVLNTWVTEKKIEKLNGAPISTLSDGFGDRYRNLAKATQDFLEAAQKYAVSKKGAV